VNCCARDPPPTSEGRAEFTEPQAGAGQRADDESGIRISRLHESCDLSGSEWLHKVAVSRAVDVLKRVADVQPNGTDQEIPCHGGDFGDMRAPMMKAARTG
jgi:hypothetical protein